MLRRFLRHIWHAIVTLIRHFHYAINSRHADDYMPSRHYCFHAISGYWLRHHFIDTISISSHISFSFSFSFLLIAAIYLRQRSRLIRHYVITRQRRRHCHFHGYAISLLFVGSLLPLIPCRRLPMPLLYALRFRHAITRRHWLCSPFAYYYAAPPLATPLVSQRPHAAYAHWCRHAAVFFHWYWPYFAIIVWCLLLLLMLCRCWWCHYYYAIISRCRCRFHYCLRRHIRWYCHYATLRLFSFSLPLMPPSMMPSRRAATSFHHYWCHCYHGRHHAIFTSSRHWFDCFCFYAHAIAWLRLRLLRHAIFD